MAESKKQNVVISFLLGKWLHHPLHPALVHVPIALWVGALFFDVLTWCGVGGNALVRGSYWGILLGLLSTAIVIPAGLAEWTQIKRERPAWKLALWHMLLNVVTSALLWVSFYFRTGAAYDAVRTPLAAFVLTAVADGVLMVSGYIGGRMVYEHGVGIARYSKKKWRGLAAEGHANLPEEK